MLNLLKNDRGRLLFFPTIVAVVVFGYFFTASLVSASHLTAGYANCSTSALTAEWGSTLAPDAADICTIETACSDSVNAVNLGCFEGRSADVSVGLFQINIINYCTDIIGWNGKFGDTAPNKADCWIKAGKTTADLDTCARAHGLGNANLSATLAKQLYDAREADPLVSNPWCAWGAAWTTTIGFCAPSVGAGCTGAPRGDGNYSAYLAFLGTTPPSGPGPGGGGTGSVPLGPIRLNVGYPTIPYPGGDFNLADRVESGNFSIADIVRFFFAVSLWIGGITAFLSLIYAGFLYIFSGANPGNRARAKNRLWAVMWGLGILFLAVVILNLINPNIASLELGSTQNVQVCPASGGTGCIVRPVGPAGPAVPPPIGTGFFCTGSGPGSRFEDNVIGTTLDGVADNICDVVGNVSKSSIHDWLASIVADTNKCTSEDVDEVKDWLDTNCADIAPDVVVGGLAFNDSTVHPRICRYDITLGYDGVTYGGALAPYLPFTVLGGAPLILPMPDTLSKIRENTHCLAGFITPGCDLGDINHLCRQVPTPTSCFINDPAAGPPVFFGDLTFNQLENGLAHFCTYIHPGAL